VAEAYAEKLYRSEPAPDHPSGCLARGQCALAQRHRQLVALAALLHKAEENLLPRRRTWSGQLDEYRESLITYAYEQALVRQKLDTNISEKEIARYYTENMKNFELKDDLVRGPMVQIEGEGQTGTEESGGPFGAATNRPIGMNWKSLSPNADPPSTIPTRSGWPSVDLPAPSALHPDNPTDWSPRRTLKAIHSSWVSLMVDPRWAIRTSSSCRSAGLSLAQRSSTFFSSRLSFSLNLNHRARTRSSFSSKFFMFSV